MSLYCYCCSQEIEPGSDADLLSNGYYKHRTCFALNYSVVYQRRTVEIFWGDPEASDRMLPYYIYMIEKVGGKVLYHNSDIITVIYPSDFQERLARYFGDSGTDLASNFWGITGIRKQLKENLPRKYQERKFPKLLFAESKRVFMPKRIRRLLNPFANIYIERI